MKKYYFKQYKKKSGTLIPFSLIKNVPFKTKRIFIIYGNKNFIRGNHAHYKCSQFLIPIYGINGAAFASFASLLFWNIVMVIVVKKKFGFYSFYFPILTK